MSQHNKPSEQVADRLRILGKRVDTLPSDRGQYVFSTMVGSTSNLYPYNSVLHSALVGTMHTLIAPCDYTELISAGIVLVGASGTLMNFSFRITHGPIGGSYLSYDSGVINTSITVVAGTIALFDILPYLTTLLRGEFIGVGMTRVSGGQVYELGVALYF